MNKIIFIIFTFIIYLFIISCSINNNNQKGKEGDFLFRKCSECKKVNF